jgi:hypothetical protein
MTGRKPRQLVSLAAAARVPLTPPLVEGPLAGDGRLRSGGPQESWHRDGPYPQRLREQFEGVIWRFRTGGQ